jgi:hypothetical protein
MVNLVSKALADSAISTYYLSTFTSDFALVPCDLLAKAVNVLCSNYGAVLEEEEEEEVVVVNDER